MFVLLWVLKLATHAPGVGMIARVFRNERAALAAAAALFLIVLFSAATVAHWIEGDRQTEHFGSIPASLWWVMVTLTTTGYGDVVPLTTGGRMLGGMVMLRVSVWRCFPASWRAGSPRKCGGEFVRIWELVARVPFFPRSGNRHCRHRRTPRSRDFRHARWWFEEAQPAIQCSSSSRARSRCGSRIARRRCGGDFFGEWRCSTAHRVRLMVTVTPCTVLLLNVADFYQLAGQQPALIAPIEAEAKRRRGGRRRRCFPNSARPESAMRPHSHTNVSSTLTRILRPSAGVHCWRYCCSCRDCRRAQPRLNTLTNGQHLYLPIYAFIVHGDLDKNSVAKQLPVSALVSIHNTDLDKPLKLLSARYYSTEGKFLRNFISSPRILKPMETLELLVERRDVVGGSGANFVIQWESEVPISPPLVQALHVELQTNRAIVFTTDAVLIPR